MCIRDSGIGGGGGGGGGLMSGRSAASTITRATAILGAVFIVNCLALSIVFNIETQDQSIIDVEGEVETLTTDTDSGETIIPSLDVTPDVPETDEVLPEPSESDPAVETEETPDTP